METWEDCREAWAALGRQAQDAMWGRAAVAALVLAKFGSEKLTEFAEQVQQSRATVYRLAQLHEAFPDESRRLDTLSFYHHVEALKAADPRAALEKAAEEGWSVRALREHLKAPDPAAALVAAAEAEQDAEDDAPPPDLKAEDIRIRRVAQRCPRRLLPALAETLRYVLEQVEARLNAEST